MLWFVFSGDLNETETTVGYLTEFYMWDYELTLSDLNEQNYSSSANIVTWSMANFSLDEKVPYVSEEFPITCKW